MVEMVLQEVTEPQGIIFKSFSAEQVEAYFGMTQTERIMAWVLSPTERETFMRTDTADRERLAMLCIFGSSDDSSPPPPLPPRVYSANAEGLQGAAATLLPTWAIASNEGDVDFAAAAARGRDVYRQSKSAREADAAVGAGAAVKDAGGVIKAPSVMPDTYEDEDEERIADFPGGMMALENGMHDGWKDKPEPAPVVAKVCTECKEPATGDAKFCPMCGADALEDRRPELWAMGIPVD
eukprot:gene3447-20089_t